MCQNEYERMISGQLYRASQPQLSEIALKGRLAIEQYNRLSRTETEQRRTLLKNTLKAMGEHCHIESPFYVDYGCNISVGAHFYANFDCIMLDVAPITIGDHVMFGPRVSLYTATHPLDADVRTRGLEYGLPITIKDQCWLCGNVVVNPGVTIGERTIIASGSVVTHDIPANVIAGGNPCRVLRELTDADRLHWEQQERAYYEAQHS